MSVTDQQLRAVAAHLLEDAAVGHAKPTVTLLAERAGITRPTLYRNHPAAVEDFLAEVAKMRAAKRRKTIPGRVDDDKLARLRHDNEQLKLHLDLYEEHIRRLTTENMRLCIELEAATGVARLSVMRAGGR